jgi:hypothetical protein
MRSNSKPNQLQEGRKKEEKKKLQEGSTIHPHSLTVYFTSIVFHGSIL